MLAILKTSSNASSNGLQTTGDFGSAISASASEAALYSLISKTAFSSFLGRSFPLLGLFKVSKHITPSKQSSKPSLSRTLAAWFLSALVKIYIKRSNHYHMHFSDIDDTLYPTSSGLSQHVKNNIEGNYIL